MCVPVALAPLRLLLLLRFTCSPSLLMQHPTLPPAVAPAAAIVVLRMMVMILHKGGVTAGRGRLAPAQRYILLMA